MNPNPKSLPLILVNLGPVPNYLKANIQYMGNTFPERRKILIGNIDKPNWLESSQFEYISVSSLITDWPSQFVTTGNQRYFRNDFWFATKARLLLLPRVMRQESLAQVLHIENDVWIHPDFPFKFFETVRVPLLFPRVDSERGIASTLFINGEDGIRILECACRDWSTMTDMQILGNILNSNSKDLELKSTYSLQHDAQDEWLFDGAKLGMYLFGTDPRNNKGLIKRFAHSPMKKLESGQRIYIDSHRLKLQTDNGSHPIASLHVHSKDVSIFRDGWEMSINRQLRKAKLGIDYGFSWSGFWLSILEVIERIMRKLKFLI